MFRSASLICSLCLFTTTLLAGCSSDSGSTTPPTDPDTTSTSDGSGDLNDGGSSTVDTTTGAADTPTGSVDVSTTVDTATSTPDATTSTPDATTSTPDATGPTDTGTTPPEPDVTETCSANGDCAAGEVCIDGTCTMAPCEEDADCPFQQLCHLGTCMINPMVCNGNVEGALQPFGGSCCYTTAAHPNNPGCHFSFDGYDSDCLDTQCETGVCSGGSSGRYCSKGCIVYDDSFNNDTGEEGSDGIVDSIQPDDCVAGFPADGPMGTNFRCVNLRAPDKDPLGFCRPGTTFRDCLSDSDCPDNEVCNLLYVRGESEKRCMTRVKDAGNGGDACNTDPAAGEVNYCSGPFCFGYGCVDTCGYEDDCATDACVDGFCEKGGSFCETNSECSATTCEELTPYSDSDYTDTFCMPRGCETIGGCNDPDWFCRPYWNGTSVVEDVALAPACRRIEEGTVGYGEACGYEDDGSGLPACAWYYGCYDGLCAGPCQSDDDCGGDLTCFRGPEWEIDVDDDDEVDTYVDVDICQAWPQYGSETSCADDGDCDETEHCEYRVASTTNDDGKTWGVEYVCRNDYEDQVEFGEVCGSGNGECASDLCLVPSGSSNQDSMCTTYCSSASDCPETFEFDGYTWKSICLSFNVSHNSTPDPIDDAFVPYCWRASSIGSLDPCDGERKCSNSKDYCNALTIAGNPDEAVVVEHLCMDVGYGLDAYPTKDVGEPCESWTECKGRSCLSDGQGGGYCSELCVTDAGCQNPESSLDLRCTEQTLVPRPDDANSGKTARCRMAETCMVCESDDDCGGDQRCVNMGGLGGLADLRCGDPCTTSADCQDPDASECTQHITPMGAPTEVYACLPNTCE